MAGLIKSQIVKHLSKFAKNVTADQISVEILRGTSALTNIELNEAVLTDILELPVWLKIKKAVCNRVMLKVPWTRLKSSPIQLFVDEITVQVELNVDSEPRSMSNSQSQNILSAYAVPDTSYGFANRVVEGISLYINTLEIHFTSKLFGGSLMLSRLSVESCTPGWLPASDLRMTRISDHVSKQAMIFKQVGWNLLRIEASSRRDQAEVRHTPVNAPLRLITSQGKCLVTIKKSTIDGSVLAGRLQLILEDILWVATLAQIRSAISFYRYLVELIGKAAEINKVDRSRIALRQTLVSAANSSRPRQNLKPDLNTVANSAFDHFDFGHTSYHCYFGKIDLHLCDDANPGLDLPDDWDIHTGALQITLHKCSLDFYPYHLAVGDRSYWVRYEKVPSSYVDWVCQLLAHYRKNFISGLDSRKRREFQSCWPNLVSQCYVVRIKELTVNCVTDRNSKKESFKVMLRSDPEHSSSEQPVIHAEFCDFFHPHDVDLPLPPSCSHVHVSPVEFLLDLRTIRWLFYVYKDICNTLDLKADALDSLPHSDVRIEVTKPKVTIPFPYDIDVHHQPKRPSCLCVRMATLLLTNNCLVGGNVDSDGLKNAVIHLCDRNFWSTRTVSIGGRQLAGLPLETDTFRRYLAGLCELMTSRYRYSDETRSTVDDARVPSASSDLWLIETSPLSVDFIGSPVHYARSKLFISDVSWLIWAVPEINATVDRPDLYLIVQPKSSHPISIIIDHYQYLQILRLTDKLTKFVDMLTADQRFFAANSRPDSTCVIFACSIDRIKIALLLPADAAVNPFDDPVVNEDKSSDLPPVDTDPDSIFDQENSRLTNPTDDFGDDRVDSPDFPNFAQLSYEIYGTNLDDILSIATDQSDDDQFIVLDSTDSAPFGNVFADDNKGRHVVEEAQEAVESEPMAGVFLDETISQMMSVIIVDLAGSDLLIGVSGDCSKTIFQSQSVIVKETSHIPFSEILLKMADGSFDETLKRSNDRIPLEIEIVSNGLQDLGTLTGVVNDLEVSISDANLTKLAAFIQDDDPEDVMAFRISINDANIVIINDKKSNPLRMKIKSSLILQGNIAEDEIPRKAKIDKEIKLIKENAELRSKLELANQSVQQLVFERDRNLSLK